QGRATGLREVAAGVDQFDRRGAELTIDNAASAGKSTSAGNDAASAGNSTSAGSLPPSLLATLPGHYYTDPTVFALEQDKIFESMWFAVARVDDIATPGKFE